MEWISVKPNPADNDDHPETLPPLDTVVWIIYLSDYNDEPVMSFGGRSDGGEGWLWGRDYSGHHSPSWEAEIECDDEYRVIYWAEIEWPNTQRTNSRRRAT